MAVHTIPCGLQGMPGRFPAGALVADRRPAKSGNLRRNAPAGSRSYPAGCRPRSARMSSAAPRHIPVLGREAVAMLGPKDGGIYLDATFGAGGYSRAILEAADTRVIGIDRDPNAITDGADLVER